MEKIVRVGTIPVTAKKRASVYVTISTDREYASFTGVVGPTVGGNALGGCGQISMEFAHRNPADNDKRYTEPTRPSDFNFADGWNAHEWLDLLDTWKRLHMARTPEAIAEVEQYAARLPAADRAPAWV